LVPGPPLFEPPQALSVIAAHTAVTTSGQTSPLRIAIIPTLFKMLPALLRATRLKSAESAPSQDG
jgi:hypothetical protein